MSGLDIAENSIHSKSEASDRHEGLCAIPVISEPILYEEFFSKYMVTNTPCLFSNYITQEWCSRKEWVEGDSPSFERLEELFGSTAVPVADCKQRYYNSQEKKDWILRDYLKYWREFIAKGYSPKEPLLYLKDWHFREDFPNYEAYRTPVFFASDWLNEYWKTEISDKEKDDYQFVYMGPKHTWTPLHVDVFSSYSWSANIIGKKKWVLFPPGEEECLKDTFGKLAYSITSSELANHKVYPNYEKASCRKFEVIQNSGEAIFVPSGWHHQVWNLEDTISINHNWFNGTNISTVWKALQSTLSVVMREIEDCKEMDGWLNQCQLMLKAVHGMHYEDFFHVLACVVKNRLKQSLFPSGDGWQFQFDGWKLSHNHLVFDLLQIKKLLLEMCKDDNFAALLCDSSDVCCNMENLMGCIDSVCS